MIENLARLWSISLIDQLHKCGISHFYLSPGMRNAPLISALKNLQQEGRDIQVHLGIDERAMSYRALGYAKASGKIPALICTSGTALANYTPAVVEAYKSGNGMLIISADRPSELVMGDANQTIVQNDFYGKFSCCSFSFEVSALLPKYKAALRALPFAIDQIKKRHFSAHINIGFSEPLDGSACDIPSDMRELFYQTFLRPHAYCHMPQSSSASSNAVDKVLEELISKYNNPLIVIGDLPFYSPKHAVLETLQFLSRQQIPFILDVTCGVKYQFTLQDGLIPAFDHPEVIKQFELRPPDVIIHLGGRMTSKHYYQYLQNGPELDLYSVSDTHLLCDPTLSSQCHLDLNPIVFLKLLLEKCQQAISQKGYIFNPQNAHQRADFFSFIKKKRELIDNAPLTFPFVSKTIVEYSPDQTCLFLGNSTAIRSFDSYASIDSTSQLQVISNRGAAGIEGHLACAIGSQDDQSSSDRGRTVLVYGDVSALYDLNSFMLLSQLQTPMTIVIINNQCGGIFNLLPLKDMQQELELMTTPHSINFEHIAQAFSINYLRVNAKDEFIQAYKSSFLSTKHLLLEVCINDPENVELYKQLKTVRL